MLLGTLGASILGNLLTGRGVIAKSQAQGIYRAGKGRETNRAGEVIVRTGYRNRSSKMAFKMLPHSLTNFQIQKYYQNEPRFNGFCARHNLPKIKDMAYVITFDEYPDIGTHWVALWVDNNVLLISIVSG